MLSLLAILALGDILDVAQILPFFAPVFPQNESVQSIQPGGDRARMDS